MPFMSLQLQANDCESNDHRVRKGVGSLELTITSEVSSTDTRKYNRNSFDFFIIPVNKLSLIEYSIKEYT